MTGRDKEKSVAPGRRSSHVIAVKLWLRSGLAIRAALWCVVQCAGAGTRITLAYPNYNYRASTNAVEIPAALLVAPFFDATADPAVNYGAIGTVLGQMITAGFISPGGAYDSHGRLNPWLSASASTQLGALGARLETQYSSVEPMPGVHINGALVLGEALADLGGLQIALDAYHLSQHRSPALLDGLTGDQRFFLGLAQMWRAKFPTEFVRNQIATGANAPPFQRVNGPIVHVDAWYQAFDIRAGDKKYVAPDKRVRLW